MGSAGRLRGLRETVEAAAVREAYEETGLRVNLVRQFHTYSGRARPAGHTVSVVFVPQRRRAQGGDDASEARAFDPARLPAEMAFDHRRIIQDYLSGKYL